MVRSGGAGRGLHKLGRYLISPTSVALSINEVSESVGENDIK